MELFKKPSPSYPPSVLLSTVELAWVYASDILELSSKLTIPFNSTSHESTYETVVFNFLALSYSILASVLYF